jgi:hypothetical protein
MEFIQELSYLKRDDKVVGIKLPCGINVIKYGNKGYLIEFSKTRWKSSFIRQATDSKKSVMGFGIDEKEKEMLKYALDGCSKL